MISKTRDEGECSSIPQVPLPISILGRHNKRRLVEVPPAATTNVRRNALLSRRGHRMRHKREGKGVGVVRGVAAVCALRRRRGSAPAEAAAEALQTAAHCAPVAFISSIAITISPTTIGIEKCRSVVIVTRRTKGGTRFNVVAAAALRW